MAAYTDAAAIAAHLSVTFTPEQEAQAEVVAAAVTAFIDRRTGRSWQTPTPIDGEVLPVVLPLPGDVYGAVARVYLAHSPVMTVDAVALRASDPNAAPTAVDAGGWELIDASHGVVLLPGYGYPYGYGYGYADGGSALLAVVNYSYVAAPPDDLAYAATLLAGEMLFSTLHPEAAGLESLALGQGDIVMRYASGGSGGSGSSGGGGGGSSAMAVIDSYRRVVIA